MPGVPRIRVEADALVFELVSFHRRAQTVSRPRLALGILRRDELRESLTLSDGICFRGSWNSPLRKRSQRRFVIGNHQPAQEDKNAIPNRRREGFGVACDVLRSEER